VSKLGSKFLHVLALQHYALYQKNPVLLAYCAIINVSIAFSVQSVITNMCVWHEGTEMTGLTNCRLKIAVYFNVVLMRRYVK